MQQCKDCSVKSCIAKGKDREVLCSSFKSWKVLRQKDPKDPMSVSLLPPLKREIELPAL
jgi:hypothetical protein